MNIRTQLIDHINLTLPRAKAVNSEEFDENIMGGIWLRGSEDYENNLPIFDEWFNENTDAMHPLLWQIVKSYEWFSEPYDAGTLMLFPREV